jgi:putative peptide zinc metalloprotease protein
MTPGELVEVYVKPGQWVEAGQKLARLSNPDVDLKVADQLREIRETQGRRECLEQQLSERGAQGSGRAAAYGEEINKLDKELKSLREKLKEAEEEQAKLCLRASRSGYVLPPPGVFPPREPDGPLPTWSGTPLERNLGAHLEKNTEVCLIGNPRELKAVLVVEQGDFAFVHAGQRASIKLDQLPDDVLEGTVEKTAETPLRASSKRMSSKFAGELATKTDATGVERPITTSYEAYVPLDNPDLVLRLGARGRGKIHMQGWSEWQTLGGRFWRMINRTFNFKL